MASRFLETPSQTPIQTRATIPAEVEIEVGAAAVDQSCQAGTIRLNRLCVILRLSAGGISVDKYTVVSVYGVLFLDWNTQGNPENPPFQGVRPYFVTRRSFAVVLS
jgi:hypothetical protein